MTGVYKESVKIQRELASKLYAAVKTAYERVENKNSDYAKELKELVYLHYNVHQIWLNANDEIRVFEKLIPPDDVKENKL